MDGKSQGIKLPTLWLSDESQQSMFLLVLLALLLSVVCDKIPFLINYCFPLLNKHVLYCDLLPAEGL